MSNKTTVTTSKSKEDLVKHLKNIEEHTEIIKFGKDTTSPDGSYGYALLEEYTKKHQKQEPGSKGSFNEYLQIKFKDNPKYKNKVIVAEISGQIGEDYDDGDKEYDSVYLDGADLTGSRLVDVDISSSLKGVTLRDCYFENVTFANTDLSGIDLRGTKLKKCAFFNYTRSSVPKKLKGMQFSMANPTALIKDGLFNIKDTSLFTKRIDKATSDIEQDVISKQNLEIETYLKSHKKQQSWLSWGGDFIITTDFTKQEQEEVKKIKLKHQKELHSRIEEATKEINTKCTLELQDIKTDSTYRPNMSIADAKAVKLHIKVTQENLREYIVSCKQNKNPMSLSEYISSKNQDLITTKENASNQKVIVVPDLSKQTISDMDFSGLDLSGVDLSYSTLTNCKFDEAELVGTCMEGSILENVSFHKADLTDCNLIMAKGDKEINFSEALMPRVQMQHSNFQKANMNGALLFSADLTRANIAESELKNAICTKCDFEGGNLRSIDARYADMRKSSLKNAIANNAKLVEANLMEANLQGLQAKSADFSKASLKLANAEMANFKSAILNGIKGDEINLRGSILEKAELKKAELKKAILDEVDARFADFSDALMHDASAKAADFSNANMQKLQAERLDVSKSVMKEVNLIAANLKKATMQEVDLYKSNLKKAMLDGVDARFAKMVGCDFSESSLRRINIKHANIAKSEFNKANLKGVIFDEHTLTLDAHLKTAVGAEGLKSLQEEQHKIHKAMLGRSRYGTCNTKDAADRFACQRIGAAILSTSIGGSTGVVLAGPMAGIGGAAATAFLSDYSLNMVKDTYYEEGYLNNIVGDRLAEIGAIAMASGSYSIEAGIHAAVATTICTSVGMVSSLGVSIAGGITSYAGVKTLRYGMKQKKNLKSISVKAIGVGMSVLGVGASAIGLSGMAATFSTIASGALYGGAAGAAYGAYHAGKSLYEYDDKKKSTGMRPEDIYKASTLRLSSVLRRFIPTLSKIITGIAIGVSIALVATAIIYFAPIVPLVGIIGLKVSSVAIIATKVSLISTIAPACMLSGFIGGYLYEDKFKFWQKTKKTSKQMNRSSEVTVSSNDSSGGRTQVIDIEKATTHSPNSAEHNPADIIKDSINITSQQNTKPLEIQYKGSFVSKVANRGEQSKSVTLSKKENHKSIIKNKKTNQRGRQHLRGG